jgi:hypothetical protein
MFRAFLTLFRRRRFDVIDADEFGPRLTRQQLLVLFRGREDELIRAFAQLCLCHRAASQRAVEDKSNLPAGQTAFEAGAAAAFTDLLTTLRGLQRGQIDDLLEKWFRDAKERP